MWEMENTLERKTKIPRKTSLKQKQDMDIKKREYLNHKKSSSSFKRRKSMNTKIYTNTHDVWKIILEKLYG